MFSSEDTETRAFTREIARHAENIGQGDVVTKVFEERKNGVTAIKIQVIKQGKVTETVYHLENNNFSISVPVGPITAQLSKTSAAKTPDTGILVFSQKLEYAREAMLKTEYVKALEAVNQALQIDSMNPQAHMMKGSIFYAMGKYDLAKKEFDYVLKIDPENFEVKRFKEFMEAKEEQSDKVKIEGLEDQ